MPNPQSPLLTVEITSFSFKAPLPPHLFSLDEGRHGGGFVFDCRSLPNPGRLEEFKSKTGLDADVRAYLESAPEVAAFREHSFNLVEGAVKNFLERGFSFMNVSFGCTGGTTPLGILYRELVSAFSVNLRPEHRDEGRSL